MVKTDWTNNDTIMPRDMNAIGEELNDHGASIGDMSSVPTAAKNAAEAIAELYSEINNPEIIYSELTSGVQTVQGGKAPSLAYPSTEGRTLVNLLGDAGGMESAALWNDYQTTHSVDEENKVQGVYAMRVALGTGYTAGSMYRTLNLYAGRYYVIIANLKNGNLSGGIRIALNNPSAGTANYTDTTRYGTVFLKVNPTMDTFDNINIGLAGAAGQYGYADALRVYEITAAEYTAMNSMTAEQINVKYPYVGTGIHGIKDLVIESVQDNLLPPINEWLDMTTGGTPAYSAGTVSSPYKTTIAMSNSAEYFYMYTVNVEPDAQYVISGIAAGRKIQWHFKDSNMQDVGERQYLAGDSEIITVPSNISKMTVFLNSEGINGSHTFENWMLIKGNSPQSFKPQSKTALTAYIELHSSKDGSIKDILQFADGRPKKTKRWHKVILDGATFPIEYNSSGTGYKRVNIRITGYENNNFYTTKYDGKLLTPVPTGGTWDKGDLARLWTSDNGHIISISNEDSGWGDLYTPTVDEIKAFFNGWFMFTQGQNPVNPSAMYNGTGTKLWKPANDRGGTNTLLTLPTGVTPNHTPYELLYQLKSPTIEDVQTSGAIIINDRENYVTVAGKIPSKAVALQYTDSIYSSLENVEREVSRISTNREINIMPLGYNPVNLKATGRYAIGNPEGFPYGGTYYFDVSRFSDKYLTQDAYASATTRKLSRYFINGTWTKWEEFYSSENNAASLAINGYQRLASGLIIQWGQANVVGGTPYALTFPIAFPTACASIQITLNTSGDFICSAQIVSKTAANLYQNGAGSKQVYWLAVGY